MILAEDTYLGLSSTAWTAWGAIGSVLAAGGALGVVFLTRHQILAAKSPDLMAGMSIVNVSVALKDLTVYGKLHDEMDVADNHYPRIPIALTNIGMGVAKRLTYEWNFNAKAILHFLHEGYFEGSSSIDGAGIAFKVNGGFETYEYDERPLTIPFIPPSKQFIIKLPFWYLQLYSLALASKDYAEQFSPGMEIELPSIGLTLNYQDSYGRKLKASFKINVSAHRPTYANFNCYQIAFVAYSEDLKMNFFDKLRLWCESLGKCSCEGDFEQI